MDEPWQPVNLDAVFLHRLGVVVHLPSDLGEQFGVGFAPRLAGILLEELEGVRLHPGELFVHAWNPLEYAIILGQG